jgi:hypothetical protein
MRLILFFYLSIAGQIASNAGKGEGCAPTERSSGVKDGTLAVLMKWSQSITEKLLA